MEDSELHEFVAFLKSLPEKSECTLQCFDRGEIYTLYNQDAVTVCNDMFGNTAKLKTLNLKGGKSLIYVNIRKVNAEAFFRHFLLKRHYRVELFTRKSRNHCDWQVEFRASPGNLEQFEDILFTNVAEVVSNSTVLAVKVSGSNNAFTVSVALCDSSARTLQVCEFTDAEELFHLVALLAQIECFECLHVHSNLPVTSVAMTNVKQIMKRAGILLSDVKKDLMTTKEVSSCLEMLVKKPKDSVALPALKALGNDLTEGCVSCLGAIFKFLKVKEDDSNANSYHLSRLNLEGHVRLDSVALTTLNMLPCSGERNRFESLYGVLNHCRTPQGQRLLLQWIRQPLVDKHVIEERLDLVEGLVLDNEMRTSLFEDFLRRIPDLHKLAKRLAKSKTALQDCYRLYQAVHRHGLLKELLTKYQGDKKAAFSDAFLKPLDEMSENFKKFIDLIESTLDMNLVKEQEFLVRDDFDENLTELKGKMNEIEEMVEKEFQKVARMAGLDAHKNVKLEFNMTQGFLMKITRKEEIRIRDMSSVMVVETQKNGVKFRSSLMSRYSEEFISLKESYMDQQKGIVEEIVRIACGYTDMFQQYGHLLASLDVFVSLAVAACSGPTSYVRPKMLSRGSGRIFLRQCRHPCLELQESLAFIANDFLAEKGSNHFHVITGPNMGGKSTFIRSVALVVLMAQIGSFVPCEEAEISIVDGVMTRVGSCDSQLLGVSTFLAEMLEASYFLSTATQDSLIIIDELGRGTSTYDGFGLAWSIAAHVAQEVKAFGLFATHFHELTEMEHEVAGVCNHHVEATVADGELVMLHRIVPGPCSQSFGLHVARMARLPEAVLKYAENVAHDFESLQVLHTRGKKTGEEKAPAYPSEEYIKELKVMKVRLCGMNLDGLSEEELEEKKKSLLREIQENPVLRELASRVVA